MKTMVDTVWEDGGTAVLSSGGSLANGHVSLIVTQDGYEDESSGLSLTIPKARALAALLLKHADRAEGKT